MWFIVPRLLLAVPTLICVVFAGFVLTRLLPGDPAVLYAAAPGMGGEELVALRAELGLDQPLAIQFLGYLSGLARGEFGNSLATGRPVAEELARRLPASLELAFAALALALLIALPLGIAAVIRPGGWLDGLCRCVAAAGLAIPTFVTGLSFIYIFYFLGDLTPAPMGRLDPFLNQPPPRTGFLIVDSLLDGNLAALRSALAHLILPSATMALFALGPIARVTRAAMRDAIGRDYIRAARARGLSRRMILTTYALRNALLPVITTIGLTFAYMLGANVVIEKVFAWPGLGTFAMDALAALDYAPLQGFLLVISAVLIAANLLVDLVHVLIDPRTTHHS